MRLTWLSAKWALVVDARIAHHRRPEIEADAAKVSTCTANKTDVSTAKIKLFAFLRKTKSKS